MRSLQRGRLMERVLRLLLTHPLADSARVAVVILGAVVVFGVAAIDYIAGQRLSLSVFYVIPVALVAALIGSRAAYLLAIESAVVWVAAEALLQLHPDPVSSGVNAILRVGTLTLVVALVGALRGAVEEAHASTQAAQSFLSTAAHQLRTPVTGLVVIAEAAASEPDADRRLQLQYQLEESTARVSRLLGLLLQMARLDQRQAIPTQLIDVEPLVAREMDVARAHHPTVVFTLVADDSGQIHGDAHSLGEALSNLLDNAGRHAASRVSIRIATEQTDRVSIEIADDGPGVPLGMEEAIFERFVSLDGSGGSGLGLPIAQAAAQAHGGDLSYRGRFRLELPLVGNR